MILLKIIQYKLVINLGYYYVELKIKIWLYILTLCLIILQIRIFFCLY